MQSYFFDNKSKIVKDDLVKNIKAGDKLSVIASVFSMYAYDELKEQLESLDEFRFIFTSQSFTKQSTPKEKREFYIPRLNREKSLYGTDLEIKLRNELKQKSIASECANWIKQKAKFKSFEDGKTMGNDFLNIKTDEDNIAYTPFPEFTTSGIGVSKSDTSFLNIMRLGTQESQSLLQVFENAWNSEELHDVTDSVIDSITVMYQENAPELIYYMALYRIFNEFLDDISEDFLPNEGTGFKDSIIWHKLYDFQRDAVTSIINKLETYNGCILADSVGLGKTYTALAVIKYYECRNRNVLVLCPKKLKDNWITYRSNLINNPIAEDKLRYDVVFHTDLSRNGGHTETGLQLDLINWGNYDLVVIDESHNFRNGGDSATDERMNRYQVLMEKIIKQGVKTKVLMLSATPVNNRFRDLRNQLALAYGGDKGAWTNKLDLSTDVDSVFKNAQTVYSKWAKFDPEERTTQALTDMLDFDFFEILDKVTVARSRKHIQRYYDMEALGPFPRRLKPISKRPKLSTYSDSFNYHEIYNELDSLQLAVYIPSSYLHPSCISKYSENKGGGGNLTLAGRETGIRKLMSTNMLKRLESSVYSFRLTLQRVLEQMQQAIKTIEEYINDKSNRHGKASKTFVDDEFLDSNIGLDLDEEESFEIGNKVKIALEDMDYISWQRDIAADIEVMQKLLSMIENIDAVHDSKLIELCEQISYKVKHPINKDNKKVLIFTAFADTADYLYENVSDYAKSNLGLECAKVTGNSNMCTIKGISSDMQEILTCFSPVSKERDTVAPSLENCDIDIVIATDCISEGQNLQDCDYLINYDIHWNPVRIVQRFGRIDRIGSKNDCIQLVNYWPDIELDEYINLKARVQDRMRIAVMSSTGDDDYINEEESGDLEYRRRQLEQMQNEVVDLEDVSGGVSITDLGLNEFRMDLVEYYKKNPDIERLPSGMNAVVEGEDPGVIFVLHNRNQGVNISGKNHLHPFYVVYVGECGTIINSHLEPKAVLDDMRILCRGKNKPDMPLCKEFNKETKNGKDMSACAELLKNAVHSIVDSKEQSDVESFFSGGTTSFLENDIEGIDDFELICFLVVRPKC